MDDETVLRMVEACIKLYFLQCADEFQRSPVGHAWENLENAMWARQALQSSHTMKKCLPLIREAGVGQWVGILRDVHRPGN